MLKTRLTENYGGINISGDYDDLNELYDAIIYLLKEESCSDNEIIMQNHLFGFLYDVRHAYQGSRDIELVDNGLGDETKKYYKIKGNVEKNAYFSFNYSMMDLIFDMVLVRYFINSLDKKERNDRLNVNVCLVNAFYGKCLNCLSDFLTPIKFSKVRKGILESYISDRVFYPQWFEVIACDYLNYSKKNREKEFMKCASAIYDFLSYIDFLKMKSDVEYYCKENNCLIGDVRMGNYPNEVIW